MNGVQAARSVIDHVLMLGWPRLIFVSRLIIISFGFGCTDAHSLGTDDAYRHSVYIHGMRHPVSVTVGP